MSYGYRFPAEFVNKTSSEVYFTWSAAQALVYNVKVQEAHYYYRFYQVFGGEIPKADQKYSHLLTDPVTKKRHIEWLEDVPGEVLRNGAVLYIKAVSGAKSGLTKKPRTKRIKAADRSLWLTSELFTIKDLGGRWYELNFVVGKYRRQVARIRFKAHRSFEMPNSVHVKTKGSKLFVSFSSPEDADARGAFGAYDRLRQRRCDAFADANGGLWSQAH